MRPSPRFFWLLVMAMVTSLIGFGLLAWRLSQRTANPTQEMPLQWADDQLLWAGGNETQIIPPTDTFFFEAPHPLNGPAFTLEVSAQISQTADPLTAWGIALENDNDTWTIIGINGVGYVTARHCSQAAIVRLDTCAPLTEPTQQILTYWKPFRFIHLRGATNAIRLDFVASQNHLTLHLNQEWMWDLPYAPTSQALRWGLWIQGGPDLLSGITWDKTQVRSNQ